MSIDIRQSSFTWL